MVVDGYQSLWLRCNLLRDCYSPIDFVQVCSVWSLCSWVKSQEMIRNAEHLASDLLGYLNPIFSRTSHSLFGSSLLWSGATSMPRQLHLVILICFSHVQ